MPQREIPARDWSKSRHMTFTNMQQRSGIVPSIVTLLTVVPSQRALFDTPH